MYKETMELLKPTMKGLQKIARRAQGISHKRKTIQLSELDSLQRKRDWKRFVYDSGNQLFVLGNFSLIFQKMFVSPYDGGRVAFRAEDNYIMFPGISGVIISQDYVIGDVFILVSRYGEEYVILAQNRE